MTATEYIRRYGSILKCRCCGVDKTDPELIAAIVKLCNVTGQALTPTCAYRCEKHNAEVGGHPRSRHIEGRAIDIRTELDLSKHASLYFKSKKRYSWGWHLQLDEARK